MTGEIILARIKELEAQRDRLVQEANLQLANLNGRIDELQKLLDGYKEQTQEAASGAG